MSEDLLAKEREFRRLNRELEQRTRDLMKEVNSVIVRKADDDDSNESCRPTATSSSRTKTVSKTSKEPVTKMSEMKLENCSSRTTDSSSLQLLRQRIKVDGVDDDENANGGSSKGNKAIINFLNAKIDMLHNEVQMIQGEYRKKDNSCKELEAEKKKLEDAKTKLSSQVGSLKETIAKLEGTNRDLESQCQSLNVENVALKKDVEELKRETKSLNQQGNNYDLRLNRCLEENEKLRQSLKHSATEEKELRDQIRKLHEEKRLAVKNLEKQRSELVQAFKKQMLLVDNLKKQNAYLLAAGQIRLAEEDFSRLLDWRPQNSGEL